MDKVNLTETIDAVIIRGENKIIDQEINTAHGVYTAKCYDEKGNLKWEDTFENLVTDAGARFLLDTAFGGTSNSTYFLGLTEGSPSGANADTMSSHAGWIEAQGWSLPAANARAAITWLGASSRSKAITSAPSFTASVGVTVGGCFIVTGAGAVATSRDTNGILYSIGAFSGGNKTLALNDTLQVSYTTSA